MASIVTSLLIASIKGISQLPFGWTQGLGRTLGKSLLRFDKRSVSAIQKNLGFCFPELSKQQQAHIAKARLGFMGQTLTEMSHLWVKDPVQIRQYLTPSDNLEFEQALASDGGVIILAPHLGNWEMLNFYVSQFRNMTVMYRPQKDQQLDEFILTARQRVGSELAPTNRKGVMQLMKALKNNGLVGILPDQVPQQGSGVFAPFFGLPAYTMTLASQLSRKTQAKVFVGAAFQVKGGYQVVVQPVPEAFYGADEVQSATAINQAIESLVRLHPEQYQWEYKRFKLQPEGQPSLYK